MKKTINKTAGVLLIIIACVLLVGCYDATLEREYREDLVIRLEDRDAEIVIREWSFLLGSGAEVYYRENGKETKLGTTGGADDGYCPFAAGKYEFTQDGNTITLKWFFNTPDIWHDETFELPAVSS